MTMHLMSRYSRVLTAVLAALVVISSATQALAQTGTLAEPFPQPAQNAALHYQRALLYLTKLNDSQLEILAKPVWETLPGRVNKELPKGVGSLLFRGRYAIRSAATGSRISNCNFGIDFSDLGASAQLPHVDGMIKLGRLLTLRGAHAESKGKWEEAAIIYFDGLRMGKHLTHQNTLLEALAGMEVLRNNYFALSRWSARCPSRPLVARAFGLMESMQRSLIDPSLVLARESSIMALDFDALQSAYPDGNWAEMILNSAGQEAAKSREETEKIAKAFCEKRGVPKEVFSSPQAFREYVSKLKATANRFAESVTACMTLAPKARLQRAAGLKRKYSKLITLLTNDTLVDPVEIGALLAEHEAELTVARLALAVSASKSSGKFPKELKQVAPRFGGNLPMNPYSGEPVAYQTGSDDVEFSLTISGKEGLAAVSFASAPPKVAQ